MASLPSSAVTLLPHDPAWALRAAQEAERLRAALGANLIEVHHIGSTAIPGIEAKPIIDLMGIVRDLSSVDRANGVMAAIGFRAHGEFGIDGRRYFTWTDPTSGERKVHVHLFAVGSAHILRHLAFRDFMRAHPTEARAYEAEKRRCRDLHAANSRSYAEAKSAWVAAAERRALAWWDAMRA